MAIPPKKRLLERWESDNNQQNFEFEVLHRGPVKRNEKFKRTEQSVTFKIKHNLTTIINLFDIKEELTQKFNELIDEMKRGADPEHYIVVELSTPVLETPIFIGHQKIKHFNEEKDIVFDRINKHLQSAKHIFADGIIELRVVIIEDIRGGGPIKSSKAPITKEDISSNKRSVVTINNQDNLCAFRALYVSKYFHDNKHNLNMKDWQNVRKDIKKVQTIGAKEIAKRCGLEHCQSVGMAEWKAIQNHLPEYQIKVIDGSMKKNFIFQGPIKDKKLYIEYLNQHFNSIIKIKSYMTHKYYCESCHQVFSNLFQHRCEHLCESCHEDCIKEDSEVTCDECKRRFKGFDCYNRHLNNRVCHYIKLCEKCGLEYRDKHKCDEFNCKKCHQKYQVQPHFCYIKSKNKEELQEEDKINKIIVAYDIESTQEGGEHVPNLLIQKTKCDNCSEVNEQCDRCYVPKQEYYFGKSCVKEFVRYLFVDLAKKAEESNSMIYAFAHNARGYDAQFILRELWSHNFKGLDVIMRGRKILIIRCGNIKMLDSLNYFLLSLADLPKAFGLDVSIKKGDFPHLFNKESNYKYRGSIPDIEYFSPDYLTPNKKSELLKWHKEYKESGKSWVFMDELLSYCKNDVEILMLCVMRFRQLFKQVNKIDPITRTFTLASIGLETFKAGILPDDSTLAVTPIEGYSKGKNHSWAADSWLDYIQKIKNIKLKREYQIGKYWVDGYDPIDRVVYEFCGCIWHGHACIKQDDEKLNRLKKRIEYLKSRGFKVVSIWECEFKKERSNNRELQKYYNKRYMYHKNIGIYGHASIRESFFGGRVNNLQFYRKAKDDERIEYLDVCSLYPYVLRNRIYPIGHPQVISEDFDFSLNSYFGFVKCKISSPKGLYLPVLPFMTKDKLLFPLCLHCSKSRNSKCECDDRSIINTWTTEELKLALSKGYVIDEIYEVLHYPDSECSGDLFKEYVDMWLKIKQQSSGWPSWCLTEEDKQKYIRDYEQHQGILLENDKIVKNEGLRFIAKIMLNSFWGKLAQRPNQSQTKFVTTYDEYFDIIIDEKKEILGELMVNEDTLVVDWHFKEDCFDKVKNYNIAVGSYVTAYARLKLYEIMEEIERIRPYSLLYHDTDSVIFVRKLTDPKIACGDYLGDLTDEIEKNYGKDARCVEFVSLGPKNYAYIVDLGNGQFVTEIKCKGIALTCLARDFVTFAKMVELAVKYSQNGEIEEILVPQRQFTINAHCQIKTRQFDKIYKAVSEKRWIQGELTFPYGY